jgi:hypothetical protein
MNKSEIALTGYGCHLCSGVWTPNTPHYSQNKKFCYLKCHMFGNRKPTTVTSFTSGEDARQQSATSQPMISPHIHQLYSDKL